MYAILHFCRRRHSHAQNLTINLVERVDLRAACSLSGPRG